MHNPKKMALSDETCAVLHVFFSLAMRCMMGKGAKTTKFTHVRFIYNAYEPTYLSSQRTATTGYSILATRDVVAKDQDH